MMRQSRLFTCVVLAAGLLLAGGRAFAQTVTTGTLSGLVKDAQGGVLPGATVTAVNQQTGTTYEAVTQGDGHFSFLNTRVGPYTVTVHMDGFKDQKFSDVVVKLGEEHLLDFVLELASVSEVVTVTAEASLIDSSRAGAASNVTNEALQSLPTVSRSLFDFARLSPYFTPTALNDDPNSISVAGQNNRYNNVQIDGAVNNDLFGLAASGTPGGQTESQPISLDAIRELQLVVSSYDVRQGMFAGGSLNAITKSGTNVIRGSGYYYGRNQALVGENPDGQKIADFSDKQIGASIGGPIVPNKLFYFGNVDFGRKNQPSGFSVDNTGQQFGHVPEVDAFLAILKNKYGYDPGGTQEFIRATDNDKVFVRMDFNIGSNNQLTARHNYVKANNDIGRPTSTRYIFPDGFYRFRDTTNSTVAQLNSTLGSSYNELRFAYTRIRDNRDGPTEFPQIDVRLSDFTTQLRAGREEFSTANALDQDVVEITDDFTMIKGSHTITVGSHNEFFKFRNLFIRDAYGYYVFQSLAQFDAGIAQAYDYSYSLTSDPEQAARFKVLQWGFYAGDQWRVQPNLTLTYGARVDLPRFPDKPTANPAAVENFGYATNVVPNQVLWSPRIGFNYDMSAERRQQLRGGIGYFAGRTPYVWLSNQYGNTGIEFQRIRATENANNKIVFVPDPFNQPTSLPGVNVSTNEIDVIDPDYKYPQLVRGNIGYDRELPWSGLVATGEILFSTTVKDIRYENVNLTQAGTRPDGRPVYTRTVSAYGDVILLTNTGKGSQWSLNLKLERPWRNGWYASGSYLYGQSNSIMDGTSSQAASNWGNVYNPGNPNDPPLTRSNFDPGHRINLAFSKEFRIVGETRATASVYYNGQSGRPYSLLYSSDANGDGRTTNDLLFIPASADDVIFQGGTYDDFANFINSDSCYSDYTGRIHERNACRAPWVNQVDFKFVVGIPINRLKVDLTMDILNIGNLFNRNWGLLQYANFNDILVARYVGVDNATGKAIYNIATITSPTFTKFNRDDLKSRWQGQFGIRVQF